jgi:hypothetical protein
MGNYIRTGPFVNGSAPGISAAFLNAIENVLEQPSGGTEAGKYLLAGWGNAASDFISQYIPSLSRTSVPVSLALDEADIAHTFCAAVGNGNLTANGFQSFTTTSGAAINARVGGNYTTTW